MTMHAPSFGLTSNGVLCVRAVVGSLVFDEGTTCGRRFSKEVSASTQGFRSPPGREDIYLNCGHPAKTSDAVAYLCLLLVPMFSQD